MKLHVVISAAIIAATLVSDPADAQVRIQARPGAAQLLPVFATRSFRPRMMSLLRMPAVQDELKLDEDLKKDIDDKIKDSREESRKLIATIRNAKPAERKKAFQEYAKKSQERNKKLDKDLRGLLTPAQQKRIDEIALQQQGINALNDPAVAKKLKITDDQKKDVADVAKELQQQRIQLSKDIRNGNLERSKYQEKIKELNQGREKRTLEVLTKEQREQFEKMKGKPFKFPQRRFARPALPAGRLKLQVKPIRINGKVRKAKIRPAKPKAAKQEKKDADK